MSEKEAWEELEMVYAPLNRGYLCNQIDARFDARLAWAMRRKILIALTAMGRKVSAMPPIKCDDEYRRLIRQAFCRRMAHECQGASE